MAVVWVSIGKDSIEVIDRREKTFDISLFMRLSGDAKTRVNLISMLIFTHFNWKRKNYFKCVSVRLSWNFESHQIQFKTDFVGRKLLYGNSGNIEIKDQK